MHCSFCRGHALYAEETVRSKQSFRSFAAPSSRRLCCRLPDFPEGTPIIDLSIITTEQSLLAMSWWRNKRHLRGCFDPSLDQTMSAEAFLNELARQRRLASVPSGDPIRRDAAN